MLVLSRRVGQQVVVPQCELTVTILDASPGRVRLGFTAPPCVVVHRAELFQRAQREPEPERGDALLPLRILLADQDEYLSNAYREHFRQRGALVDVVATGLACIEHLRETPCDVLVLDPALPWGGGDGVLAVIHDEPDCRPGAVLLLTHGCERGLLYRLSKFRIDDYQLKPLSPRQLLERIRTLHNLPPPQAPSASRQPANAALHTADRAGQVS